jgi:CheY-like chemotaxis protein
MSTIKLYSNKVNIRNLIREIQSVYEVVASEKNLLFSINIAHTVPLVINLDEKRLNQILHNLIGNALKYTFIGNVSVSCNTYGKTMQISVADTGIGIKENYKLQVFKLFETHQNYQSSGIGLGLYISSLLARLMSGKISFYSQENVGSTFIATIPFEVEGGAQEDISSLMDVSTKEKCCPRVLIVDDNVFNLNVLESMLKKMHISCLKAINGQEAIKVVKESQNRKCCVPLKLVLMDCNMPVMDGYQATEEIVSLFNSHEISKIIVIGVTAYTSTEHLENCMKSGMQEASNILK